MSFTVAFMVAGLGLVSAFLGRLFALGSKPGDSDAAIDILRLRCFGGNLPWGSRAHRQRISAAVLRF